MHEQCWAWNIAGDPHLLRNFPLKNKVSWEWVGNVDSGKGYYHQETLQTSVLRKLSPADTCWETTAKYFLGNPEVLWRSLRSLSHWGCLGLRDMVRNPRGWVSKFLLLCFRVLLHWVLPPLKFCFLAYLKKRTPFLNILEITVTDYLKFETCPGVLSQGPWVLLRDLWIWVGKITLFCSLIYNWNLSFLVIMIIGKSQSS